MNTENIEDFEEDEILFKRDKISDNTYDEIEMDNSSIDFKVDASVETKSYEYTIDEKFILEKVEALLEQEVNFADFLKPDELGKFRKINKSEINSIYSYITIQLPNEPRIEIFSIVSSMFDINPDKFYESLSNTFKTELISELKDRGHIKRGNSLF